MSIVIKALAFASGASCPIAGQYLESFDFDAHDGVGFGHFTADPARAMRFADSVAAELFWARQSTVRPLRADGEPNRPLTSTTIELREMP